MKERVIGYLPAANELFVALFMRRSIMKKFAVFF
jgi:hypothetical protein